MTNTSRMIDTKKLEAFATQARTQLIREVTARITTVLGTNSKDRLETPHAVAMLETAITRHGGGALGSRRLAEEQAYVWFNRIIALRFMDANDYTPTHVVSPEGNQTTGQPASLAAVKRGEFDPDVFTSQEVIDRITTLLNGTAQSADPQGEAYGHILNAHCGYWNRVMPFMFDQEGSFTNLLKPADLLAEGSVLNQAVATLTKDDCQDVEVIGWLYQYYISERKDEVFAGFRKNKKAGPDEIPAATQLFTPDWIVRYLVQNSVGRLWMLNHPDSKLVKQMDYYVSPAGDPGEFLKIERPEELTVLDPACGSGHMLTYAFDLLYAIYEEQGHTPSEIPGLILTHNLYGIEIDRRAGTLAAFALTMKARARQRRFFAKVIQPNICVLENYPGTEFAHADLSGSLIRPAQNDQDGQPTGGLTVPAIQFAGSSDDDDLFTPSVSRYRRQVKYLASRYDVVVTNPPYMGSKNMSADLATFAKDNYPDTKSDLFAMFIERCLKLTRSAGYVGMITMQSWMFLSSYFKLRGSLLNSSTITTMAHLGARAFDSIGGEVVSSTAFTIEKSRPNGMGTFIRLVDGGNEADKSAALRVAVQDPSAPARFQARNSDFQAIPGTPIVYWLSEKMRAAFNMGRSLGDVAEPRKGLDTGENVRFLRYWWEVSRSRTASSWPSDLQWFPYNKGGEYRRWYGNQEYLINWKSDGAEIKEGLRLDINKPTIRNAAYYGRAGFTWSTVSSGAFAARYSPGGALFDNGGCTLFASSRERLLETGALLNSTVSGAYLSAIAPTLNYQPGDIATIPFIQGAFRIDVVEKLITNAQTDWDSYETSWDFKENTLVSAARTVV